MSCIIGGKCKDGVVLVADKKIRNPDTGAFEYREKLFIFQKDYFYYHIVVGSSGTVPLYEKFKRKAMDTLQATSPNPAWIGFSDDMSIQVNVSGTIYPYTSMSNSAASKEVILYPYLEKLEIIIREFKKTYSPEDFDVLFAAQVKYRGAILSYISAAGLSEDVDKHKVIGSGEIPANVFLKAISPNDMMMKEFAKWVIS